MALYIAKYAAEAGTFELRTAKAARAVTTAHARSSLGGQRPVAGCITATASPPLRMRFDSHKAASAARGAPAPRMTRARRARRRRSRSPPAAQSAAARAPPGPRSRAGSPRGSTCARVGVQTRQRGRRQLRTPRCSGRPCAYALSPKYLGWLQGFCRPSLEQKVSAFQKMTRHSQGKAW